MRFLLEVIVPFASLAMLMILSTLSKFRFVNDWFDQWIERHVWNRDSRDVRGFEVKPITGQTPVLREKEKNDHG